MASACARDRPVSDAKAPKATPNAPTAIAIASGLSHEWITKRTHRPIY